MQRTVYVLKGNEHVVFCVPDDSSFNSVVRKHFLDVLKKTSPNISLGIRCPKSCSLHNDKSIEIDFSSEMLLVNF